MVWWIILFLIYGIGPIMADWPEWFWPDIENDNAKEQFKKMDEEHEALKKRFAAERKLQENQ